MTQQDPKIDGRTKRTVREGKAAGLSPYPREHDAEKGMIR